MSPVQRSLEQFLEYQFPFNLLDEKDSINELLLDNSVTLKIDTFVK